MELKKVLKEVGKASLVLGGLYLISRGDKILKYLKNPENREKIKNGLLIFEEILKQLSTKNYNRQIIDHSTGINSSDVITKVQQLLSSETPIGKPDTGIEWKTQGNSTLKSQEKIMEDLYTEWIEILKHPFRALIVGKAGSGKSALAHFLLDLFHFQKHIYILGFPSDKLNLLPDYINVVKNFKEVLPDSICLVDEGYLNFYSRESMAGDKNKQLLEILGLFRHKNISLIFITQNTGLIDRHIVFMTDFIIFKEISNIQIEFERPELRPLFREAKEVFEKIKDDKRTYNFVVSTDGNFKKTLKNSLPSYWNETISTAFCSWGEFGKREGKNIKKEEKKEMAKQLYQKGYSYKQVGKILGVSKATIINWVKHNR